MEIIDIGCHILFGYVQDSVESYKKIATAVPFDCKMGIENLVEIAPAVRFDIGVKEANHLFPTFHFVFLVKSQFL